MTFGLIALTVYLVGLLSLALLDRERAGEKTSSFFLADRSLGRFGTFAGISATVTGGSATVFLVQMVAQNGLAGLWYDVAGGLGLVVFGFVMAKKVRATGASSLPEVIGRIYGEATRKTASVLVVITEIVWFAFLVIGSRTLVEVMIDVDAALATILVAAVFIAYTAIGGQYSVNRTDVIQYVGILVGLVGVLLPASVIAAGGLRRVLEAGAGVDSALGPLDVALIIVTFGLPHVVGPDIWAKTLSARDTQTARSAAIYSGVAKAIFGLLLGLVAFAAVALGTVDGGRTLAATIVAVLPAGAAALVLLSLLAALQSSADTVLLTAVTTTCNDLLPARLNQVRSARVLAVVIGAIGLLVALQAKDLLTTLKLGYTIFTASLVLPTLAGFLAFRSRPSASWSRAAMVSGAGVVLFVFSQKSAVVEFAAACGLGAAWADPMVPGMITCGAILLVGGSRTRAGGRCPGDSLDGSGRLAPD